MGIARALELVARGQREEEERERAGREALAIQRAGERASQPQPNPWRPPVIAPVQPQQPSGPYGSPPLDTSAPMMGNTQTYQDTAPSRTEQPSPQMNSAVPTLAPRPMLASLSDRLRDPYNAPARPMVPTESRFAGPQEPQREQPSIWNPMSWNRKPEPEPYRTLPDEQWQPRDRRQEVFDSQPEPIQNRIGDAVNTFLQGTPQYQQGWNAVSKAWSNQAAPDVNTTRELVTGLGLQPNSNTPNTGIDPYEQIRQGYVNSPEYQYAQGKSEERRNYEVPSYDALVQERFGGSQQQLEATASPLDYGIAALTKGLNEFGPTREVLMRTGDVFDRVAGVPSTMIANRPWLMGLAPVDVLNADKDALIEGLKIVTSPSGYKPQGNMSVLEYLDQYREGRIKKAQNVRGVIAETVAEGNSYANLAARNGLSGPEAMEATLDLIVNHEKMADSLHQEAVDAQYTDPVKASQLFAQEQQLREMSYVDMVDANMNPVAELAYGVILDPTELVLGPLGAIAGLTAEARAINRANKTIDTAVTVEKLADIGKQGERLATAVAEGGRAGQKVYDEIIYPYKSAGEKFESSSWTRWMLRNATPNAKAALDTRVLSESMVGIFAGVTRKDDALKIMDTLINKPEQLVKGLANLSSEAMATFAQADDTVKWGNGLIANPEVARRLALLKTTETELMGMRSLKGKGLINPVEFQAELKEVISTAAQRVSGGKLPRSLPFGATDVKLERTGADAARVAYVDKEGKVLRRGAETTVPAAQSQLTTIQDALNPRTRKRDMPYNVAKAVGNVQRYIMNDVWLFARPANWIGNALSASVMLHANDAWGLDSNASILEWSSKKHGGFASTNRLFNAIPGAPKLTSTMSDEIGGSAIGWVASKVTGTTDNVVTKTMKGFQDVPYGSTEIPLGNGMAVPVGEEALAARAQYYPAKRAFEAEIVTNTGKTLLPRLLQGEGMTSEMAKTVQGWVTTAANNGGKSDIVPELMQRLGKPTTKRTLEQLGVPKELLSTQAAGRIERMLMDADPSDADAIATELTSIFAEERTSPARSLSIDAGEPRIDFTDADIATEAGWAAQQFLNDAVKAGVDPADARKQADELAQGYMQEQRDSWTRLVEDLAPAATNPGAWDVVVDFYLDQMKVKNVAREAVNEAGRYARDLATPEAWAEKWSVTKKTYDDLRGQLGKISEQARIDLHNVYNGGEHTPRNNWYDTVEQYALWDEEAFRGARTMDLGGVEDDVAKWEAVIKANREYVDNAQYEALGAFQRYPSLENFDLIRGGQQRIETMGAHTAHEMALLRQKRVTGDISAAEYNRTRNAKWNKFFDDAVTLHEVMGKIIVRNGIVKDTATQLKWAEGAETYQLLGPSSIPGKWRAQNVTTGAVGEEFSVGTAKAGANPFSVPKNVVDDFNRLSGNEVEIDKAADAMLDEIAQSKPAKIEPVEPTVWTEPTDAPRLSGYDDASAVRREPLPQGIPAAEAMPNNAVRSLPDDPEAAGYVAPASTGKRAAKERRDAAAGIKEPAVYTPGDAAKLDIAAAKEARSTIRSAWDKEATAGYGLGKIDSYVMKYSRDGLVNLNLNKGELKAFEDLYGTTVNGRRIENIDDVRNFLQEYVDLSERVKAGDATVDKTKQFAKMSTGEIVKSTRDELAAAGFSEAEIADLAKGPRRSALDIVASVRGDTPDDMNMVAYDSRVPSISNVLGAKDKADGVNVWQRILTGGKKSGTNRVPTQADVAAVHIQNLNDVERALKSRLPEILRGDPNTLTGAQRLRVIDAVRDWLPEYDNVATKSRLVGQQMADHIMLNVDDKKDFDTLLSVFMPYSYFWRKMPSRLASAALAKPGIVNFFYEATRALELENEQSGLPARFGETVGVPGQNARVGLGPLLRYAMGGATQYMETNPFIEPDPSDNAAERVAKQVAKYTPGFFDTVWMALDAADGKMDKDYSSMLNSRIRVPFVGAPVSSIYQRLTGDMPAQGNPWNMGFGPDKYDPGRARTAVSGIAIEEKLDEGLVSAAQQVIVNQSAGDPVELNVDPKYLQDALLLAERGVKRAADDRIVKTVTGYTMAAPVSAYKQEELDIVKAQDGYFAAGYDPIANPDGGKELQKEVIGAQPQLGNWWSKKDANKTPGIDGQIGSLYDEIAALKAADPTGNKGAISKLYDDIDTLKAQKPVDPDAAPADPTKGMNPTEKVKAEQSASASEHWDAYFAEGQDKAQYLRDNPDFVKIYDANEVKKGREVNHWWEDGSATTSKGSAALGAGGASTGGSVGLEPGSVTRADFTEAQLDQFYEDYFAFNGSKDWDGQKAWLVENPEFARLEADRKFAKDGEYPWWYDDVLGGEGAAVGAQGMKRPPSQPNSVADVLRQPYDAPGTGDNKGASKGGGASKGSSGGSGGGGGGNAYSDNWDEYKALGDDNDAKRQYMLDHPEFAEYYVGKYGEDSAWWLGEGGSDGAEWSTNWDEYGALGDDYNAKKQYMLDNPEFAAYYKNKYGSAWWEGGGGRSGGYGGGGGSPWLGGGGGGGGGGYAPRIDPRYMDRNLQDLRNVQQRWRPDYPNTDWLRAGDRIQPDPIRKWQAPRW